MNQSGFVRRFMALVRKEIHQMMRDKSNLAVGLLLPIVLILLFGYGLSMDVKHAPIAVVLEDGSPNARQALDGLRGSSFLAPVWTNSMVEAEALMRAGEVDAIVRVPVDFSRRLAASDARLQLVLNGEKTFITSGLRADYLTVAVRTDPESRGASGISLLLVEGDSPGLQRTELKKTGWWASDTAHLRFENCRVPAGHLLGGPEHVEGQGFKAIMQNFNHERLVMAASAVGYAQACTEEALAWARERKTFGRALAEHQVIRHKLVDMVQRVEVAREFVYALGWRLMHK